MKPFLFLQIRPETKASDNEFEAIKNVTTAEIYRLKICDDLLPSLNLNDYSGVILGGGPATISDDEPKKPPYQKKFEPWLFMLLREIVLKDIPFMGICYGPGAVATALGGKASKKYPEAVGAYNIQLTDIGAKEQLLNDVPLNFLAFAGHKESVEELPDNAVVLATSITCPVQAYKMGKNVYCFQFHPELDPKGLALRINTYKHMGYFKPEEAKELIEMSHNQAVTVPKKILAKFFKIYKDT
jgi:GMP synthase (glutamine-hydrolysing)